MRTAVTGWAVNTRPKSLLPLPANTGFLSGVLWVEGRFREAERTVDGQGLVSGSGF